MTATRPCNITIKLEDGQDLNLHSDREFDAWLYKHRVSLEEAFLKGKLFDKTFSLSENPVPEALARLRQSEIPTMDAVYAHAEEVNKAISQNTAGRIGPTQLYKTVGNVEKWESPLVDYSRFSRKNVEELKNQGKSETEIADILKNRNQRQKDYGTDWHKLFEYAFGQDVDGNPASPKPVSEIKGMEIIQGPFMSQTYDLAKTITDKIKKMHPKAQKFYLEKEIYSKDIDSNFLKVMNESGVHAFNGHAFTHVVGKPDLIVIDDDGQAIIYDFKTSHTSIGDSWSESTWYKEKKDDTESQLMTYAAILEQHGIKVKAVRIVSIVGKAKEGDFSTYESFTFDNIIDIPRGSKIDKVTKIRFRSQTQSDPENIARLHNAFNHAYPGTSEFLKTYLADKDIENVKNSDQVKKRDDGKWVLSKEKIAGGGTFIFDTEEELDAELAKYLPILNASRRQELQSSGEELYKLCQNQDMDGLFDWARNLSWANTYNNVANFKKYVKQGWSLINREDLLSNGIFVFQLGDRSEIIMVGVGDLHFIFDKLTKGKTVLGQFVGDDEFGNDSSYVLNSNRGHLLEMKAMMFVAQNPELFEECPIGRIKAVTLHNGTRISDGNLILQENYRRLQMRNRDVLPYLPEHLFMNDAAACVKCAEDIITCADGLNLRNPNLFTDLSDQYTVDNLDELLDLIETLEKEDNRLKTDFNNPDIPRELFLAYSELIRAYQSAHMGLDSGITSEDPIGKFFTHNINLDGVYTQSGATSNSDNYRRMDRVRNRFSRKISLEYEEQYARPWQHLMEKIYKEVEKEGISTNIGGEWRFFKNWFVTDPTTGEISSEFKLKNPDTDEYFKKHPAQQEACRFFLEKINSGRTQEQIDNGQYYQVPLMRGDFWEQMDRKGVKDAMKEWFHDKWDPIREGLMGAMDEKSDDIKTNSRLLANPFLAWDVDKNKKDRAKIIESKGVGHFSTNIDVIFLATMAWQTKVNACKTFLPSLQAFRILMQIENQTNGAKMNEIENAINDYMDRIIFNKNIMDSTLQVPYGLLAAMKSVVSKVALGFKLSSLARETGTTSIQIAINKAFGSGHGSLLHDFDKASYLSAIAELSEMTVHAYDVLSKVHQINAMFGISDFGFSKMADESKSKRFAPLNLEDSFAYWTSSASDFFHRNVMLVMKLKSIDAWNAYIQDENGDVQYDWTKDGQYQVYQKYKTYMDCPANLREKWRNQREKYLAAIEEWKILGDSYTNLKEGDPLPHALTPSDLGNLKTQSDVLFGNYDEETKSLMMYTFLGSLYMQFKIYGYARLLRYIKTPGAINVIINEPLKEINPSTGKLENIAIVVNEDGTSAEYKYESEVTDEEWASDRAKLYREKNGAFLQGHVHALSEFAAAVLSMNLTDFNAILSDPNKKYNLLMMLWDSLFAMMLMGLIAVLFGEDVIENMDEEDWFTQWSYGVATGIAKDGPIWEVAKGLYSDGTLPLLTSLKRYVNTASSVLHGNTNIVAATLNTFGATRELSHYFDN